MSNEAEMFFEAETRKHQQEVAKLLMQFAGILLKRAAVHDQSKLEEPERGIFIEFTPKLKGCTYGSDEYRGFLSEMNVALDHHYGANRHHPEFHQGETAVASMNLVDVVEMLCDWMAATQRHADGDIGKSIDHNEGRFGFHPQLSQLFRGTAAILSKEASQK